MKQSKFPVKQGWQEDGSYVSYEEALEMDAFEAGFLAARSSDVRSLESAWKEYVGDPD